MYTIQQLVTAAKKTYAKELLRPLRHNFIVKKDNDYCGCFLCAAIMEIDDLSAEELHNILYKDFDVLMKWVRTNISSEQMTFYAIVAGFDDRPLQKAYDKEIHNEANKLYKELAATYIDL